DSAHAHSAAGSRRRIDGGEARGDPMEVRNFRRLASAVVVIGAACITACFTGFPHLSSTGQDMISLSSGSNPYDYGTINVGGSKPASFTFSPSTLTDNDYIVAVTQQGGGCFEFQLSGPSPIGAGSGGGSAFHIYYDCTGTASGSGPTFTAAGSGS